MAENLNIIKWDKIRKEIETSKDIDVLLGLKDKLRAYQVLAEQSRQSVEVQAKIAIYKARADRKCGEWLAENVKQGQRGDLSQDVISLKNIKVSLNESSRLQKIASIPDNKFEDILQEAEEATIKITNNMLVSIAKEAQKVARETINAVPLPEGKYSVIYADPPWPVSETQWNKWESRIIDKYPTMPVEEIKNLKVSELASDNSCLFLWTTHSFLHEAFHVIEAWGFKYYATITWDKGGGWTQDGFYKNTEFCLFAYHGKMTIKQIGEAIPAIIKEKKTEHSVKPEKLRQIIEEKTSGKRIELFARKKYDGWESWGNQV